MLTSQRKKNTGPKKIAAIYARVSSEKQKEEGTVASQIAALIEYAEQEGFSVPQEWIFSDEGYSGSNLKRPQLERLRDLSAEGQIETILIFSPDRLSRKYAYQVLLTEEFTRQNIEVIFIKFPKATTPEEQLLLQFQGMIAEYERAQIVERSRRGKRYKAKNGSINTLSGAPYGYRYMKKTDTTAAYYEILEKEAGIVRKVFDLYAQGEKNINEIARWLNEQNTPTRTGASHWCRSTVWAMLRNPAYEGRACYGKTETKQRERVTRPLRKRGGYTPHSGANRELPREQWIEIPVPALVPKEVFELAQQQLQKNKQYSTRRTIEPTLLQSMLVCNKCGYAYYRTATRTSKRKIYYYRCLGSDNYRYPNGRVCDSKPIRQDYLDELVWNQITQLLQTPDLVHQEIQRRLENIRNSNPRRIRKQTLNSEHKCVHKSIEKLIDAYQEGLINLAELRRRMPDLRKREQSLASEITDLDMAEVEQQTFLKLVHNVERFLSQLKTNASSLDINERQKVVRLLVKEILIDVDRIKIKHSIPVRNNFSPPILTSGSSSESYLLRSGRHDSALRGPSLTGFVFSIFMNACF